METIHTEIYNLKPPIVDTLLQNATVEDMNGAFQAKAKVALERDLLILREHRINSGLATRTWMQFMTTAFGSIMIVIGCSFVLGRIKTESNEGHVDIGTVSASLVTSSPGLMLAFFGGILICVPHYFFNPITVKDKAAFVGAIVGETANLGAGAGGVESNPSASAEATASRQALIQSLIDGPTTQTGGN
ncbi:hypothetical protein V5T82_03070 [Magnetovibrio sp. PR-2]|uniref:hypothetical protein n=1 Tax=Magnetovibrio sp. PR-2 TaxID=3120356 RepID=UPI002FCDE4CF